MNRIPQSDELIDGLDSSEPEFIQTLAEHTDNEYNELNFDLVEEFNEIDEVSNTEREIDEE